MEKQPWQTLSKNIVYENPWLQIQHHEIIDPSGSAGVYGVVHFKNLAIGVLPLDEFGNTWIVGQNRYPLGKYSWEMPEGGGAMTDAPVISAQRELKEEVGITAKRWTKLMELHTSNSVTDEFGIVYIAQDLTFGDTEHEATEDITVRKLHFSELLDMVMNGEITDAITIAAVLKVQVLMQQGKFSF